MRIKHSAQCQGHNKHSININYCYSEPHLGQVKEMEGIGYYLVLRPLLALNQQALPTKWTCIRLDSTTLTFQLQFLSFSQRAAFTELMKYNQSGLQLKPTHLLPYAWHMWAHCKQLCMKRKKGRKWQLMPFQWKGWGNLQPRHCHLQEVKGTIGHSCQNVSTWTLQLWARWSLWADPGWESKHGLWWGGGAIAKQNFLSFGKCCLSLLREFTSSVTTDKLMVINKRQWGWASPFWSSNKRSLCNLCCTLISGIWTRWWVGFSLRWFKDKMIFRFSVFGAWGFDFLNGKVLLRGLGFCKAEIFGLIWMIQVPLFQSFFRSRDIS